jgi:hypothetical protein
MDDKTIKGSILIAEYMGYKIEYVDGNIPYVKIQSVDKSIKLIEWARYHRDIEMLFPVIEKIIDTIKDKEYNKHPRFIMQTRYCEISFSYHAMMSSPMSSNNESRVRCMFSCVILFLEWFNLRKKDFIYE